MAEATGNVPQEAREAARNAERAKIASAFEHLKRLDANPPTENGGRLQHRALKVLASEVAKKLEERGMIRNIKTRMNRAVSQIDLKTTEPDEARQAFEATVTQYVQKQIEQNKDGDWNLNVGGTMKVRDKTATYNFKFEVLEDYAPFIGYFVGRSGRRLEVEVAQQQGYHVPQEAVDSVKPHDDWEWQVPGGKTTQPVGAAPTGAGNAAGGGNGEPPEPPDAGGPKTPEKIEGEAQINNLIAGYERDGKINHIDFIALRDAINKLPDKQTRDFYSIRLALIADVTGITTGVNPTERNKESKGLDLSIRGEEVGVLLERRKGALEAMGDLMAWAGFAEGRLVPDQSITLDNIGMSDIVPDEIKSTFKDMKDVFKDDWDRIQNLSVWWLAKQDHAAFRNIIGYLICKRAGIEISKYGSDEVQNTAAMLESLLKHSRVLNRFMPDNSHSLNGASEGWAILSPGRAAVVKAAKRGVHQDVILEVVRAKYDRAFLQRVRARISDPNDAVAYKYRKLIKDEDLDDAKNLFDLPEELAIHLGVDLSIGGLFFNRPTSYWLTDISVTREGRKNAGADRDKADEKDKVGTLMNMIFRKHVPTAADFYPGMDAFIGGQVWVMAAEMDKFYSKLNPLGSAETAGWGRKLVVGGGENTPWRLMVENFKIPKGETSDPDAQKKFKSMVNDMLKSIITARLGIEPDNNKGDKFRIKAREDVLFSDRIALNTWGFEYRGGGLPVVDDELWKWLTERSGQSGIAVAQERYWRIRRDGMLPYYERWIQSRERGGEDDLTERDRVAGVLSWKQQYEDYVTYHSLTPSERAAKTGDDRLFYSIQFDKKISVLALGVDSEKEAEQAKLKPPDRIDFPVPQGWLLTNSILVSEMRKFFDDLSRAGYFSYTTTAEMEGVLYKQFLGTYLKGKLGMNDKRLVVFKDEKREDYFAELLTALESVTVDLDHEGNKWTGSILQSPYDTSGRRRIPVRASAVDLRSDLINLFQFSNNPVDVEVRRRRGILIDGERPLGWAEETNRRAYRDVVFLKAVNNDLSYAPKGIKLEKPLDGYLTRLGTLARSAPPTGSPFTDPLTGNVHERRWVGEGLSGGGSR